METKMTLREWQNKYKAGTLEIDIYPKAFCFGGSFSDWTSDELLLDPRADSEILDIIAPMLLAIKNADILDNYKFWANSHRDYNVPLLELKYYDIIGFEPIAESERETKYFAAIAGDSRDEALWRIKTIDDLNENKPGRGAATAAEAAQIIDSLKFE